MVLNKSKRLIFVLAGVVLGLLTLFYVGLASGFIGLESLNVVDGDGLLAILVRENGPGSGGIGMIFREIGAGSGNIGMIFREIGTGSGGISLLF